MRRWLALAIATSTTAACQPPREEEPISIEISPAGGRPSGRASAGNDLSPRLLRRFQAIDATPDERTATDAARVALGKKLFYDASLSETGDVACATCHELDRGGADDHARSIGVHNRVTARNAPTVLNASAQFRFFWDGRAATLEEQAKGPLFSPNEMGMKDAAAVVHAVAQNPEYTAEFARAFPEDARAMTFENVVEAITAFERTLVTRSRWDDFLEGEGDALSREEKVGLKTFLDAGCMVCHTGKLLGGNMFARVGIAAAWPNQSDAGRMEVTHDENDRMMFKVPTLRNVALTAPYFHDGSSSTLEDAVHKMATHQLGTSLTEDEVHAIVTWMQCLTGKVAPEALANR